ncbi:hypothetical protein LVD17_24550 [Fulvivirga ulvae]|uniref:hypothetical protein n=1 Tax=Fulvivirga ulvae TaxID=2904245 RepID=UPI001F2C7580|nr:hypothetical protein [Fulvivirga ulvae]UII31467.1 hypothetical protein LVD17_24550 [Fulvivirga ulvae]
MQVGYINTDQPFLANKYLGGLVNNEYQHHGKHDIYSPTFQSDGEHLPVRNIIRGVYENTKIFDRIMKVVKKYHELN